MAEESTGAATAAPSSWAAELERRERIRDDWQARREQVWAERERQDREKQGKDGAP